MYSKKKQKEKKTEERKSDGQIILGKFKQLLPFSA